MKCLLVLLPLLIAGEALASEQLIIDRIEAMRATKAESEARKDEARLLAQKERWKEFKCPDTRYSVSDILTSRARCISMAYDWKGWAQNGTIHTTYRREIFRGGIYGDAQKVSVDCKSLKISLPEARMISEERELIETDPIILKRYKELNSSMQRWEIPSIGSETAMVAARCSGAN